MVFTGFAFESTIENCVESAIRENYGLTLVWDDVRARTGEPVTG
jgi:hypothetical protein